MAQGVGSAKAVRSEFDVFGGKLFGLVDYNGPASYVQGGDALDPHIFGFPNAIITLWGGADHTNTYFIEPGTTQNGVTPFRAIWKVTSTGVEVAAAVNLSTYTVRLSALGI